MPKRDAAHMASQRERIMHAALLCIADSGVDRLKVSDIWRKAGLSAGALYVHFKSKDEIINAMLEHFSNLNDEPQIDTWAVLKQMTVQVSESSDFETSAVRSARLHLLAEAAVAGPLHETYKGLMIRGSGAIAGILRHLEDVGEIGLRLDAEKTAEALTAYVDGMWLSALVRDRPPKEMFEDISRGMDLFVELPGRSARLTRAVGARPHGEPEEKG